MTPTSLSQSQLAFISEIRATIGLCYPPLEKGFIKKVRAKVEQLTKSNPFGSVKDVAWKFKQAKTYTFKKPNQIKDKNWHKRKTHRTEMVHFLQEAINSSLASQSDRWKPQYLSAEWQKELAEQPKVMLDNLVCSKKPQCNFLGYAAYHGSAENVAWLLQNSCNPNHSHTYKTTVDYGFITRDEISESMPPVFLAAESPIVKLDYKINIVGMLLAAGANVLQRDLGGNFWIAETCTSVPVKVFQLMMESVQDMSLAQTVMISDEGVSETSTVLDKYIARTIRIISTEKTEDNECLKSSIEKAAQVLVFHGFEVPKNLKQSENNIRFGPNSELLYWPLFKHLLVQAERRYKKIRDEEYGTAQKKVVAQLAERTAFPQALVSLITSYFLIDDLKNDHSLRIAISRRCIKIMEAT